MARYIGPIASKALVTRPSMGWLQDLSKGTKPDLVTYEDVEMFLNNYNDEDHRLHEIIGLLEDQYKINSDKMWSIILDTNAYFKSIATHQEATNEVREAAFAALSSLYRGNAP